MQQKLEPEGLHGCDHEELELRGHHQSQNPLSEQEEPSGLPKLPGHHRRLGWDGAPDEQDLAGWTPREARV